MATNNQHPVVAEMMRDKDRIAVTFDYSPSRVTSAKDVPGWSFVDKAKARKVGYPAAFWRYPLDMLTCKRLREAFGDELGIGPKLRSWAKGETEEEEQLSELSIANDAELENIKKTQRFGKSNDGPNFGLRPYQRADIAFMSEAKRVICANQPRTGKTLTTISAFAEAGYEWGRHLVFAPKAALRNIWEDQIRDAYVSMYKEEPTILTGDTTPQIKAAIRVAKEMADADEAFWLVLNPYHARLKRKRKGKGDAVEFYEELVHPVLAEIDWDSITIDEFHLMGLSNPTTQGAKGVNEIAEMTSPEFRFALSGTPMGGKPIKLWGALHFLEPERFTSRWNWAKHWLVINQEGHPGGMHYNIEGIMPGREIDFYDHLKPYLVRRTQREALPGLPPVNRVNVMCDMTKTQAEQYYFFEREAEWRLDDLEEEGRLTATNILSMYTRLKQFADARCDVHKTGKVLDNGLDQLKVEHTADSGKLEQLLEKLREENVIVDKGDEDEAKCALVFSQFNPMNEMIGKALEEAGVPSLYLPSGMHKTKRDAYAGPKGAFQLQEPVTVKLANGQEFTAQPPRVLVMNTAAGTALTLDRAESAHILDETWVPDNQEQAEQRMTATTKERMKRESVGAYYYRSRHTIEQHVQALVAGKKLNNKTILDLRRRMQQEAERREKEESNGKAK